MNPTRSLVCFLTLVCTAAATVYAQSNTGSISGAITDPNDAAVAGGLLEAERRATGRVYKAQATEAGLYVLPTLPVGIYTVAVEHPGFKRNIQADIEVRVALRQTIDSHLEVGDVQQSVDVKAEVPLLETVTPER